MQNLTELTDSLETSWHESMHEIVTSENKWWIDDIEKEFYEEECFKMGFSDVETETILKEMGY